MSATSIEQPRIFKGGMWVTCKQKHRFVTGEPGKWTVHLLCSDAISVGSKPIAMKSSDAVDYFVPLGSARCAQQRLANAFEKLDLSADLEHTDKGADTSFPAPLAGYRKVAKVSSQHQHPRPHSHSQSCIANDPNRPVAAVPFA